MWLFLWDVECQVGVCVVQHHEKSNSIDHGNNIKNDNNNDRNNDNNVIVIKSMTIITKIIIITNNWLDWVNKWTNYDDKNVN